ncbi:MAG: hypothetical protein KKB20_22955 [Proteobacteria bacterium]|nr:hypothetical protein [Pseudomonadota bacterium]
MRRGLTIGVLVLTAGLLAALPPVMAAARDDCAFPETIDPKARYLFFMHGLITEQQGLQANHPQYGAYDYTGIIQAFQDRGFRVVSEVRPPGTAGLDYARRVAAQVKTLLDAGVPPDRVTICGFSKGGAIVLHVAVALQNPAIKYVVMAGCGKTGTFTYSGYKRFLDRAAERLKGRFLSILDVESDQVAGSCEAAFKLAGSEVKYREIDAGSGKGHGLFYKPRPEWLEPVLNWIEQAE